MEIKHGLGDKERGPLWSTFSGTRVDKPIRNLGYIFM